MLAISGVDGGLHGADDIRALQQALTALSAAKGWPGPGPIDGVVGPALMNSVTNAIAQAVPKIPDAVRIALAVAGGLGWDYIQKNQPSVYSAAQGVVMMRAGELAAAVQAYLALTGGAPAAASSGTFIRYGTMQQPWPAGSIARWHRSKEVYSIYRPLAGLGFGWAYNPVLGVASDAEPPAGTGKVGESRTLPAGVTKGEDEDYPWYKRWQTWAIVGGVAVAGGLTWYALK